MPKWTGTKYHTRKGLDSRRFSTASIHEGADSIALIPSAGDEETALNPYYNSEQIGPHNQHHLPPMLRRRKLLTFCVSFI